MLIISENKLVQTESCQDIIEHHGVRGMKWGQRTKRWGSAAGRAVVNNLRHPIISNKGIVASRKHSILGTEFGTTRSLEFRNRYVKDMVAANKQYKKDKKQANTNSKLNIERKDSISKAKAKRKQAAAMAGGRY